MDAAVFLECASSEVASGQRGASMPEWLRKWMLLFLSGQPGASMPDWLRKWMLLCSVNGFNTT